MVYPGTARELLGLVFVLVLSAPTDAESTRSVEGRVLKGIQAACLALGFHPTTNLSDTSLRWLARFLKANSDKTKE